mmetsp:Transcript_1394/g.3104  ORF Transcript_1394/g.3104 Transcript_1394/m.3104 type:complete len:283 (+) Transcript_1394:2596-3444(+)
MDNEVSRVNLEAPSSSASDTDAHELLPACQLPVDESRPVLLQQITLIFVGTSTLAIGSFRQGLKFRLQINIVLLGEPRRFSRDANGRIEIRFVIFLAADAFVGVGGFEHGECDSGLFGDVDFHFHFFHLLLPILAQHLLHLLPTLHTRILPQQPLLPLLLPRPIVLLHERLDLRLPRRIIGIFVREHFVETRVLQGIPFLRELEFFRGGPGERVFVETVGYESGGGVGCGCRCCRGGGGVVNVRVEIGRGGELLFGSFLFECGETGLFQIFLFGEGGCLSGG